MALTNDSLAAAIRADPTDAARLRPVAEALVNDFAPAAPEALRDEAGIRIAGYLLDAPPAPAGSAYADLMLNSGAVALLTAYRVRLPALISGEETDMGLTEAEVLALIDAAQHASQADLDALTVRVDALSGVVTTPATFYVGWSADRVIGTGDFATAASVQADGRVGGGHYGELVLPAQSVNAYIWAGVPEPDGVPHELTIAGGRNSIGQFPRQAGTVGDADGNPFLVLVSRQRQTYLLAGQPVTIQTGAP